jgi:hypothetical protein
LRIEKERKADREIERRMGERRETKVRKEGVHKKQTKGI